MCEWPLKEGSKKLRELVDAALAGQPQKVVGPGNRAVVILAANEYERLRQIEESHVPNLSGLLLEIPQDDQEFDRPSITPRVLEN